MSGRPGESRVESFRAGETSAGAGGRGRERRDIPMLTISYIHNFNHASNNYRLPSNHSTECGF